MSQVSALLFCLLIFVVRIVISLDNVVGIKKSFIVTYRVLYLLPDPVGNQVIDFILVLMETYGFVGTVVGFDLPPVSGIGIQILAEIVFCFRLSVLRGG